MVDDPVFSDVIDDTRSYSEKERLTPGEYRDLKRAVFGEVFAEVVYADTSYFVLGKYDDGPREGRLELVKGKLNRRDGAFAYLMKDVPEGWEYWPTKFRILADRATYIVIVLEDTDGSHEWEFGRVAGPDFRPKVHVCKREYDSREVERERFDALPAHFVDVLDRDGRVFYWQTEDELRDAVEKVP